MSDSRSAAPVERYLSSLDRELRGHARDKFRLLLELRAGLDDATDAHTAGGLPPQQASVQAVRSFGSVPELVAACQPELSVRQVRRTSRIVALTVPVLIGFWHLLFGGRSDQLTRGAVLIGEHLAGLAAATAVLAALILLLTGPLARWLPMPRRLPMLVAVTGLVSAATLTVAPLAIAAAAPSVATWWPVLLLGAVAAAVPLSAIAMSAWLCRACALPLERSG